MVSTVHIKVKILCGIIAGLEYLHSCPLDIVHCDLTPNYILPTKSLKAKIGDFGVSREIMVHLLLNHQVQL